MSEHDERKAALDADNPPQREGDSDRGLGTETGAAGGPGDEGQDVTKLIPDARGEVRYPDVEDPDERRPDTVPKEGHVEGDQEKSEETSSGAD
jgi:hypothetical protein